MQLKDPSSSVASRQSIDGSFALARILMVDDQPARLLTYESILSGLNVHCVRALSGFEALEKLLQQEFAVILLDVNMPGMDGFEAARLIREHPRLERTPIIFVTGVNVSELDRLKGYEVGAIDYISVPVVPEILRSKVAILVELYQRRSELKEVNSALAATRARLESDHASAIDERDAQLNAIFEHPVESTLVLRAERDKTGAIKDWVYANVNTNALKRLDLARESLIGRRLSEVEPQRMARESNLFAGVLATREPARYEMRLGDKDFLIGLFALGEDSVISSMLDITERKFSESSLISSERRYHALIENAPIAVAHNAMDGRFEYVNNAFCALVGYTAEELKSRTWQEITHPEDVSSDQSLANQVIAGEIPHYTLEKRYIRKDGRIVWVNLFGNFVLDEAGRPIQGVAAALDITDRKQADLALRESQQRLLIAKSAARLGTHDWNIVTGFIQWDSRIYELWGVPVGTPVTFELFRAAIHPDDHESLQDALDKALDAKGDGRYFAAYRVTNSIDGITRWIEATGQVFFEHDRAVRLVGTVQDATDRRLSEQKLQESEERFRELANNIDQFAWTCNKLGEPAWCNDRWYEYSGLTFDETRGDGWWSVLHPAHVDRVRHHMQACMRAGKAWENTYPIRRKDGQYRWFLTRAVPIYSADGQVIRWFGTNTDVTDIRNLQEALEQTDRRKDEFLAMLSHELRNPLAPINSAAQVLAKLLANDEKTRPVIDIVRRQVTHLSRLLDDLLDVARVTQGRIELRREVIPIRSCVEHAIETAATLIQEKNHRLVVIDAERPLFVSADMVRLTQCVANLLINAAKYTNDGGQIAVRIYKDGSDAVLEVADTGVGLAPDFLPRAFDLFAQGERDLDRSQGGLGIGLAICKRVIEKHGGSITAQSAGVGKGATFVIRLPLADTLDRQSRSDVASAGLQRRVLIVDDNRDAANSLDILLRMEGHTTKAVYSAEEALAQVAAFNPQIMLLDIGLPGMDGYELARQMRALGMLGRLIALSGYGQVEDRQRSAAAGFDAHLVKPVDVAALAQILAVET